MAEIITAIYENGVLRPLKPLALPEHTQVRLRLEQTIPPDVSEERRLEQALLAAGLSLTSDEIVSFPAPLSAERRQELAELFAAGGPVSELILKERRARL